MCLGRVLLLSLGLLLNFEFLCSLKFLLPPGLIFDVGFHLGDLDVGLLHLVGLILPLSLLLILLILLIILLLLLNFFLHTVLALSPGLILNRGPVPNFNISLFCVFLRRLGPLCVLRLLCVVGLLHAFWVRLWLLHAFWVRLWLPQLLKLLLGFPYLLGLLRLLVLLRLLWLFCLRELLRLLRLLGILMPVIDLRLSFTLNRHECRDQAWFWELLDKGATLEPALTRVDTVNL
mmetsp:Transcript_24421/g.61790  ORF Transcript_24421/g.61790 Transcript_24421/m.61790 type:complete len:233 (+) Transcript_24421:348-1046(+)